MLKSALTADPLPQGAPLPLKITARDGVRRVSFPAQRLWSWAEVERFELSLPLSVSEERARHTRSELTSFEVTFSLRKLEELFRQRFSQTARHLTEPSGAQRSSTQAPFSELHLKMSGQTLICWGVHQPRGLRATPFYLEGALHPSPQSLRVDLFRGWVFGVSAASSSLLAAELLRTAQLPALPSHPSALQIDPLTELSLAVCLERGWKLPKRETLTSILTPDSAHLKLIVGEGAEPYQLSGPYAEHLKGLKHNAEGEQRLFRGEHADALSFYLSMTPTPLSLQRVAELSESIYLTRAQRAEARGWLMAHLRPEDHLTALSKAWHLERLGDPRGAAEALKAWWPLASAQPEDHIARDLSTLRGVAAYSRALLLEPEDPQLALEAFEEARHALPQALGVLSGAARAALATSQVSLADERLSEQAQALEQRGRIQEAAWAWSQLAEVRRLNPHPSDPLASERAFSRALELSPQLVSAHQGLASLAEERGDRALACERLDHALSVLPSDGPARAALQEMKARLDQLSRPVQPLLSAHSSGHPTPTSPHIISSKSQAEGLTSAQLSLEPQAISAFELGASALERPLERRPKAPLAPPPRASTPVVSPYEPSSAHEPEPLRPPTHLITPTRPVLARVEAQPLASQEPTREPQQPEPDLTSTKPLTPTGRPYEQARQERPTPSPEPKRLEGAPLIEPQREEPQREEPQRELFEADSHSTEGLELEEADLKQAVKREELFQGDFLHVDYPVSASEPPQREPYALVSSPPASTPPERAPEPLDDRELSALDEGDPLESFIDVDEMSSQLLRADVWEEGLPASMERSAEPGPLMGELLEAEPLSERPQRGVPVLSSHITPVSFSVSAPLSDPPRVELADVWASDDLWEPRTAVGIGVTSNPAQPAVPITPITPITPSAPLKPPQRLTPPPLPQGAQQRSQAQESAQPGAQSLMALKESYPHLEGDERWEAALLIAQRTRDELLELAEAERFFWELLRHAPQRHPTLKVAIEELGELLTASQDLEGALSLLELSLERDLKPSAELHRRRAITLRALGRLDDALAALDACEAVGGEPSVELRVALLTELGHIAEAVAQLDAAAEAHEGNPKAQAQRARALYLSQAADLLQTLELSPHEELTRLRWAFEAESTLARAERWHTRAVERGDAEDKRDATLALARQLTSADQSPQATSEVTRRALKALTSVAADLSQSAPLHAIDLLREALSLEPSDFDAAEALYELALRLEALEALALSLKSLIPLSLEGEFKAQLSVRLAFSLASLGEEREGLSALNEALDELARAEAEQGELYERQELRELLAWGAAMCPASKRARLMARLQESLAAPFMSL